MKPFSSNNVFLVEKSKNLIQNHLDLYKNHQTNFNKTLKYFQILMEFHLNSVELEKEKNVKKKEKINQEIIKQKEFLQNTKDIDLQLLNGLQSCFYVNSHDSILSIEPEFSLKLEKYSIINQKIQNFLQTYEKQTNVKIFESSKQIEVETKISTMNEEDFDNYLIKDPYVDVDIRMEMIKEILKFFKIPFDSNFQFPKISQYKKDYLIRFNSFEDKLLEGHPKLL
jgi:hypothetical protein